MLPTNKVIWSLWYQPHGSAPELVRQCWNSWRRFNPDYELVLLDKNNLSSYIQIDEHLDITRKDITVQKIAAVARLLLLKKYGGVWTDATVFCCKPLDQWLPEYFGSGFFAFRNPGPDRYMSNWFMVSENDNLLLHTLTEEFLKYYQKNYFFNQNTKIGKFALHKLEKYFDTAPKTLFWHSFFARKVLGVYPYFIFHYTFNKVIQKYPSCRKIWHQTEPYSSSYPHLLQYFWHSQGNKLEAAQACIRAEMSPVYKLNWRWDANIEYWERVLTALNELLIPGAK